jgi:phosphoglycerate dehydrogenase-like enzyme
MLFRTVRELTLILSILIALPVNAADGPSPAARTLIEELSLAESPTPIADNSQWSPQRIVVMQIPAMGIQSPEFEADMQKAAGNVELVFDRSGSFIPPAEILVGADAVIGICTPPLLKNADTRLLWIHNYSVGMDHCKGLSDKQKEQIVFSNNKRLSAPAIAEHTIAMLLSLANNLPDYHQAKNEKKWDRTLAANDSFGELKGKTLLVVGLGGIGTEIAWRAHGLGMQVIATRNSSRDGPEYVDYVGLADELFELAGKADVIVNALPLTPKTKGIFNKAFFDAAKPGSIFLSVGRGKSTVTADLVAALESGKLHGAGLDVTNPEPLPKSSPLWHMPNVIITPHVSAAGKDSARRTMIIAVENLRRYVAGEPLLNIVNISQGY